MAEKEVDYSDLRFEEMDGHELFRPTHLVRPSEAIRLTAKSSGLEGLGESAESADAAGDFIEFLEDNFITDKEGWQAFFAEHGLADCLALAGAYVGELVGVKS